MVRRAKIHVQNLSIMIVSLQEVNDLCLILGETKGYCLIHLHAVTISLLLLKTSKSQFTYIMDYNDALTCVELFWKNDDPINEK